MSSEPPPPARLFFGFWPTREAAAAIVAWRVAWNLGAAARWSPVANLHVTLLFLGDVRHDAIADLVDAVTPLQFQPSRVEVGSPDLWPRGIALLHVAVRDALRSLHADLGSAVGSLGRPVDSRPWQPHLTLARRAAPGPAPPPLSVGWTMSGFSLIESAEGRYREIAAFPAA